MFYRARLGCNCRVGGTHDLPPTIRSTVFLKAIIFARPIFLFKSFVQTKWAKNEQKSLKYDPKKVKQW